MQAAHAPLFRSPVPSQPGARRPLYGSPAMTVRFVTRHPGAIEWAARQGLQVDRRLAHLDPTAIQPGDVVIGILPVNLAAEVCARGGRYFNLSIDLPESARGLELSADDLDAFGARLEEFALQAIPVAPICCGWVFVCGVGEQWQWRNRKTQTFPRGRVS